MNKNYLLIILLFQTLVLTSQVLEIPDKNLKAALLNHNPIIDTNADNQIQLSEAIAYTGYLDVSLVDFTEFEKQISDFTGLNEFVNITGLNAFGHNYYGSFDFSQNTELEELILGSNNFDLLGISANLKLKSLDVSSSNLSSLDVSHLVDLEILNIRHTNFSNIDVSNNLKIKEFTFFGSEISNIDLSNNIALEDLSTGGAPISALDISKNINLKDLEIQSSTYDQIDLSKNIALERIACYGSQISSFDFSKNTNLLSFGCGNNLFESLDFSKNTKFERFVSQGNDNLISVNLANGNNANFSYFSANSSPNLETICVDNVEYAVTNFINIDNSDVFTICEEPVVYIPDPNFKSYLINNNLINTNGDNEIQVSEAQNFAGSVIASNQNISNLTGIEAFININTLRVSSNNLSGNINLTENKLLLTLAIENNSNITEIVLPEPTLLEEIYIGETSITSIDLSQSPNLVSFDGYLTPLKQIDFSQNNKLDYVLLESTELEFINLKNGTNESLGLAFSLPSNSPELKTVCVDNIDYAIQNFSSPIAGTSNDVFSTCDDPVVYIPDANFKAVLLNNTNINTNGDNEIQFSEAEAYTEQITAYEQNINDATGVEAFINIKSISLSDNNLTSIDFSKNTKLEYIYIDNNELETLDISELSILKSIVCRGNSLETLDFSNNPLLDYLLCWSNDLTSLNITSNTLLKTLSCGHNENLTELILPESDTLFRLDFNNTGIQYIDVTSLPNLEHFNASSGSLKEIDLSQNSLLSYVSISFSNQLEYINLKNGANELIIDNPVVNNDGLNVNNCEKLVSICVDNIEYATVNFIDVDDHVVFTDDFDCNINLYNTIEGTLKINSNNDSCLTGDPLSNFNVHITNTDGFSKCIVTNADGFFSLQVPNIDTYTVALSNQLGENFITPNDISVTFDSYNTTKEASFCIESAEESTDLEIIIIPISEPRPGFETYNDIVYSNNGDSVINGTITLEYNNEILTDLMLTPNANSLESNLITWTFENLKPFEQRVIFADFRILPPPTVNGGEILSYTANISSEETDIDPSNNTYELEQLIVNSFDPNDKNVLQGAEILEEQVNDYLDYVVRFENTGTASAINVRITDTLDENLDWSTFEFVNSSHTCVTSINNGNEVEFNFENIFLPFTDEDPVGSNGYVAFRIKPKSDVILGDTISGTAEIFFDFNLPIVTNTVTTEVVEEEQLSINSFSKNDITLQIFPNPVTNNEFKITTSKLVSSYKIKLFDLTGKEIELEVISENYTEKNFSIPDLTSGVYLLKVNNIVTKLIKK